MITRKPLYLFLLFVLINACKPEIYSFSANPKIITERDSVHLTWDIHGKPELTFHQNKIAYSGGDSLQQLQFSLVAVKGGSRTTPRLIELNVLPLIIPGCICASGYRPAWRYAGGRRNQGQSL